MPDTPAMDSNAVTANRDVAPKITIAIPMYKELEIVADKDQAIYRMLLDSINNAKKAYPNAQIEVLLGVNGPDDGSLRVIKQTIESDLGKAINLRLVQSEPGKTVAMHKMLEESSFKGQKDASILFMDADVSWSPRTLTKLIDEKVQHPDYNVICGMLAPFNGGNQVPQDDFQKAQWLSRIATYEATMKMEKAAREGKEIEDTVTQPYPHGRTMMMDLSLAEEAFARMTPEAMRQRIQAVADGNDLQAKETLKAVGSLDEHFKVILDSKGQVKLPSLGDDSLLPLVLIEIAHEKGVPYAQASEHVTRLAPEADVRFFSAAKQSEKDGVSLRVDIQVATAYEGLGFPKEIVGAIRDDAARYKEARGKYKVEVATEFASKVGQDISAFGATMRLTPDMLENLLAFNQNDSWGHRVLYPNGQYNPQGISEVIERRAEIQRSTGQDAWMTAQSTKASQAEQLETTYHTPTSQELVEQAKLLPHPEREPSDLKPSRKVTSEVMLSDIAEFARNTTHANVELTTHSYNPPITGEIPPSDLSSHIKKEVPSPEATGQAPIRNAPLTPNPPHPAEAARPAPAALPAAQGAPSSQQVNTHPMEPAQAKPAAPQIADPEAVKLYNEKLKGTNSKISNLNQQIDDANGRLMQEAAGQSARTGVDVGKHVQKFMHYEVGQYIPTDRPVTVSEATRMAVTNEAKLAYNADIHAINQKQVAPYNAKVMHIAQNMAGIAEIEAFNKAMKERNVPLHDAILKTEEYNHKIAETNKQGTKFAPLEEPQHLKYIEAGQSLEEARKISQYNKEVVAYNGGVQQHNNATIQYNTRLFEAYREASRTGDTKHVQALEEERIQVERARNPEFEAQNARRANTMHALTEGANAGMAALSIAGRLSN